MNAVMRATVAGEVVVDQCSVPLVTIDQRVVKITGCGGGVRGRGNRGLAVTIDQWSMGQGVG